MAPTTLSHLTTSRGWDLNFRGFELLLRTGSCAGLIALLRAIGERVILFLLLLNVTAVLETRGFLRHLLHSGALLLKCVVAADVVRVGPILLAHAVVRLLMNASCVVVLSILHNAVNEQSTVNSLGVDHGVSSFSVTLHFVKLTLGDSILVKVVKVSNLIGNFKVLHIVNFTPR